MPGQAASARVRGEYRKSAQTRAAILDAALDVFSQVGYHRGSLRAIAERVGMTDAGMLHHFPSKKALLQAVLELRDSRSRSAMDAAGPTPRDQLRALVELARTSEQTVGLVALYARMSAEATDPAHPAHEYFVARYTRVRESIEGPLRRLAATGELRAGIDPARAAATAVALWDGLQLQWLLDPESTDVPAALHDHFSSLLPHPL